MNFSDHLNSDVFGHTLNRFLCPLNYFIRLGFGAVRADNRHFHFAAVLQIAVLLGKSHDVINRAVDATSDDRTAILNLLRVIIQRFVSDDFLSGYEQKEIGIDAYLNRKIIMLRRIIF